MRVHFALLISGALTFCTNDLLATVTEKTVIGPENAPYQISIESYADQKTSVEDREFFKQIQYDYAQRYYDPRYNVDLSKEEYEQKVAIYRSQKGFDDFDKGLCSLLLMRDKDDYIKGGAYFYEKERSVHFYLAGLAADLPLPASGFLCTQATSFDFFPDANYLIVLTKANDINPMHRILSGLGFKKAEGSIEAILALFDHSKPGDFSIELDCAFVKERPAS